MAEAYLAFLPLVFAPLLVVFFETGFLAAAMAFSFLGVRVTEP